MTGAGEGCGMEFKYHMRTEETFDRVTQVYVRKPGKNFAEGISPAIGIPDFESVLLQHKNYCTALQQCGASVSILKTDPLFPDGCFLNDMAVVTEKMAVISNFPDQSPRQGEQQAHATILGATHFLKYITAPGRLDASDVLQVKDRYYIGLSDHTNRTGAEQLVAHLMEFGYHGSILDLSQENIVRLKSAATYLGKDRLLIREELARHYAFLEYEKTIVPQSQKAAANALMLNGTLILSAGYPDIVEEIRIFGIPVLEVDTSEFEKMNGGPGCLSIRLPHLEKGNVVLMPSLGKKTA